MTRIQRTLRLPSGLKITEILTRYPCRHLHYRYDVDGKGPSRAKRVRKGSAAWQRFWKLKEEMEEQDD